MMPDVGDDLRRFADGQRFRTVLADPPWRFANRAGKMAPEYRRLRRYHTLPLEQIARLPLCALTHEPAHLYLWVPNALLPQGLAVMQAWGFTYKATIVWHKIRKDGGSDGRGVGFYFRNVTETLLYGIRRASCWHLPFQILTDALLFGVRGKLRTLEAGRRQTNLIASRKREHSRKPDEQYTLIESCSPGPYLELFARGSRPGWACWGNEAEMALPLNKRCTNYADGSR